MNIAIQNEISQMSPEEREKVTIGTLHQAIAQYIEGTSSILWKNLIEEKEVIPFLTMYVEEVTRQEAGYVRAGLSPEGARERAMAESLPPPGTSI